MGPHDRTGLRRLVTPSPLVLALMVTLATGAAGQISAPDIPYVCLDEPTPGLQLACAQKYTAFYAYLGQMALGQATHTLPDDLAEAIQPYFPGIDVSEWQFGFSDRQPPDNATTACEVTWFSDPTMVDQLRTGDGLRRIYLMAHEIRHWEQCVEVGGRDAYSKLWWYDLEVSALLQVLKGGNLDMLHDDMSMEMDADARGIDVENAMLECCIHPMGGAFVAPIQMGQLQISASSVKVDQSVLMSISASGGAQPYDIEWTADRPGGEVRIGEGESLYWRPEDAGNYTVRMTLSQGKFSCDGDGELPCEVQEASLTVQPREPGVTSLRLDRSVIEPGEEATVSITAEDIEDGETISVTVDASSPLLSAPSATTIQGTGGWQGSGSFKISAGPTEDGTLLFGDRHVTLTVGVANDPSRSAQASITIDGYEVQDFRAVAVRDRAGREVYEIRVELDRRVRVPVTLSLESGDPRSLSLPTEITIPAGARSATLQVSPPRTLRSATDVTVRLRHLAPQFTTRESVVTVRPGGG